MKKDYTTKKKAVIAALSLVAVCLAGGLFYYIGTMGGQSQETPVANTAPVETQIVVPEITPEATPKPAQTDSRISDVETSENPVEPSQGTALPADSGTQGQEQSKPSDGKPKSPAEATPPPKLPTENSNNQSGQSQPQGGEKRTDGAVYVPGFGWVEYEGENSQGMAPNAGTGEQVGNM